MKKIRRSLQLNPVKSQTLFWVSRFRFVWLPVFLVYIMMILLTSCSKKSDQSFSNKAHESEDSILVGEVSSLTGSEATYGMSAHQGILLAVQEVNLRGGIQGKKIKMVSLDSQGKADESARAISKLITLPGMSSIITGVISSNALAMTPIAQDQKIPFIATISTHPKVTEQGNYIFRVCLMDSFQGIVMAKFAFDTLGVKKVAIFRDLKSDYSAALAESFIATFQKAGGEIVIHQTYSAGDIDFKAQLTAIRAKQPSLLYLPGYYTDVSLIARQARDLGLNIPLAGGDGWDSSKLREIGGKALQGSYYSASYSYQNPSPLLKEFLSSYKKMYGILPDGLAVTGYEGMQVLISALKSAQSLNPEGIRSALAKLSDLTTVTGKISFDSSRNAIRSAVILEIKKDGDAEYRATVAP